MPLCWGVGLLLALTALAVIVAFHAGQPRPPQDDRELTEATPAEVAAAAQDPTPALADADAAVPSCAGEEAARAAVMWWRERSYIADGDTFFVDMTYSRVSPLPDRPMPGEPFTREFSVQVDENSVPITPFELGEPAYQWRVRACYSTSPAGPFWEAPPGCWWHSFSSPDGAATAVTFTTWPGGYWRFYVGACVEYWDSVGNHWAGETSVTIVESTQGPMASPPRKAARYPGSLARGSGQSVPQLRRRRGPQGHHKAELNLGLLCPFRA